MNIFYINEDPKIASLEHCDKHAVKMCVESMHNYYQLHIDY